jgi:hypothetical protein
VLLGLVVRSAWEASGTRPGHKDYVFPTKSHMHLIPGRTLSKGTFILHPTTASRFLDFAPILSLDINSDSHRFFLALNMNFDDVEERDGLLLPHSRANHFFNL